MDAPFDRGEIDRASLDATERLRARLSGRPMAPTPAPRRSVLPWVLAGSLFVFTAGMIANPWFERSVRGRLPFGSATVTAPLVVPAPVAAGPAGSVDPTTTVPAGERLARTEAKIETSTAQMARDGERIDRLTSEVGGLAAKIDAETGRTEAASAAAVAAADHAQAMIAVLLARQAIESGRSLGSVEAVLRQSFETRYPQAVANVAALGNAPVTLAGLRHDFAVLPVAINAPGLDWWQSLTFAVRSAVRSGNAPLLPSEAAAAALAHGDVAAAANQLRRLPNPRAAAVTEWLADADRLTTGYAALTALETAAVMVPVPAPKPAPRP